MTNRITDELLANGKSATVEFKASGISMAEIGMVVCAFLNTKGGVLILGVDGEGVPDHGLAPDFAKKVDEYLRKTISPAILFDVTYDEVAEGSVVCVGVPAGPDRPYVFEDKVYIRHGEQTLAATPDGLRSLVNETNREVLRWERRPSMQFDAEQIDQRLVDETVRRSQQRRGYEYPASGDLSSKLERLSLIRSGQFTNAADVLFGQKVSQHHPQTRLRAVNYETDKSDTFIDEQLYEGPAFSILDDAMAFLKRNISIASEFSGDKLARDTKSKYPFEALREGLVNAFVHRDYAAFSGGISVSIYPSRVEIWNSGTLPKGIAPRDLVLPSHASILVNPDISHVFYLHELMERVGRGTYKIARQCGEFGMRLPEWKAIHAGVRLTLFAPVSGRIQEDLNERQKQLLAALATGKEIRVNEYLEQFGDGITDRQARRDIGNWNCTACFTALAVAQKPLMCARRISHEQPTSGHVRTQLDNGLATKTLKNRTFFNPPSHIRTQSGHNN